MSDMRMALSLFSFRNSTKLIILAESTFAGEGSIEGGEGFASVLRRNSYGQCEGFLLCRKSTSWAISCYSFFWNSFWMHIDKVSTGLHSGF